MGNQALEDCSTGGQNVAVGHDAGRNITTGAYNTIVGYASLDGSSSTAASYNVSVGSGALGNGSYAGNENTAVGHNAGHNMTTGGSNVCIGTNAGDSITDGNNNCIIGKDSDVDNSGRTRATVIGQSAGTIAQDNTFRAIGDNGAYNSANTTTWSTTSDIRIKKDVVDNDQGLDVIKQIRVRNFKYRTVEEIDAPELQQYPVKHIVVNDPKLQIGAIAQEFAEVLPDSIQTTDWGVKTINTDPLIWHLVNAVKELSAKSDTLAAEVEQLKSQLNN